MRSARPASDPRKTPGLSYVSGESALWRHGFAHAGDDPAALVEPTLLLHGANGASCLVSRPSRS